MSSKHTAPSELVRAVYFDHVDHFGEPDHFIRFGDGQIHKGELIAKPLKTNAV